MSRRKPVSRRSPAQLKAAQTARRHWWAAVTRDLVLFVTGLLLFIYEAVFRHGDPRGPVLYMEAGMMGLGAIFRGDEIRNRILGRSKDDQE